MKYVLELFKNGAYVPTMHSDDYEALVKYQIKAIPLSPDGCPPRMMGDGKLIPLPKAK
jgi:hypothetical protein